MKSFKYYLLNIRFRIFLKSTLEYNQLAKIWSPIIQSIQTKDIALEPSTIVIFSVQKSEHATKMFLPQKFNFTGSCTHGYTLDINGYLFMSHLTNKYFSRMNSFEYIVGRLFMEMKLELIAIPVTDVDVAIDFYKDNVGFNLDHDHTVNEKLRFVQMTPPGSACSICFGIGIADNMKPGSIKGLQMVVKDAQAAHDELKKRGVSVSDVEAQAWGKLVHFNDPDGNSWTLQELPPRG